ncbi:acylphosphatase [Bacillus sp. T33-2]|uniref:acylphosphatase n=1 Tax=Bacillus sp. T33-2 TaxID=2054168 RepID=UPI000C780E0A|nr:acylphosphatase [Bacillus sp. T33-2]PLR96091.1 acylphosphatase [Bacillus sp. T33-2]
MIQLKIVVSGRVQGVGYRYFTQMKAIQHGITGWVKNLPDGAVEMLAAGDKAEMNLFLEDIRRGNPFSTVDKVDIHDAGHIDNLKSFTIKY